jgi:protein ImuB
LFQSEELLVDECLSVCHTLGLTVSVAVADTPWGAQMLTQYHERFIATPGDEELALANLPVTALVFMEGLKPWDNAGSQVLQVASLFQLIGLRTIAQIQQLNVQSFQERWGDLGQQIWQRLHGLEQQFISPWTPAEPLHSYQYLDFPISLLPFLLRTLEKSLVFLFARLQGRNLFAQRLTLTLRCEYSQDCHVLTIDPATPNRDLSLYMTLIEQKLALLDFENPVREFEVDILGCDEKQRQLDFWEPRSTDQDKLQRLMSLLQQGDSQAGFFQIRNAILPEKTWTIHNQPQAFAALADEIEVEEKWHQVRPAYGQSVMHAPRPTRLLQMPKPLPEQELRTLQLISSQPMERLEEEWWGDDPQERDYYLAVSPQGQCLWVYEDLKSHSYFLHGYFD